MLFVEASVSVVVEVVALFLAGSVSALVLVVLLALVDSVVISWLVKGTLMLVGLEETFKGRVVFNKTGGSVLASAEIKL